MTVDSHQRDLQRHQQEIRTMRSLANPPIILDEPDDTGLPIDVVFSEPFSDTDWD